MNIFKKFIMLHKFFVKESASFVGVWKNEYYTKWYAPNTIFHGRYRIIRFKDRLYYPIAYLKFMYYSLMNK